MTCAVPYGAMVMFDCLFLGTGTSVGVPMIGCDCAVCTSSNPRNRRRRTSLYIVCGETHILVDTPPDFREQALAYGVRRIDGVLFTHAHADHIFGFDDIRRFNTIQDSLIPAFGGPGTVADLRRVFNYVQAEVVPGHYRPRITFSVMDGPFELGAVRVTPIPVEHGETETFGFRFDHAGTALGYIPDCHNMTAQAVASLQGLDVMVLDALRHRPHRTHLTIADSLGLLERIKARHSYLIHLCHEVEHDALSAALPAGVQVAYDGLRLALAGSGAEDQDESGQVEGIQQQQDAAFAS